MLDINDFKEKKIILVFPIDGDKISFLNDNIIIKDKENKIKHQSSCYRLFSIFIIGNTTITTPFIAKAKKYGYSIVLLTTSFRVNDIIGFKRDSNFLLHKIQYQYQSLEVGKLLIKNKIKNQIGLLKKNRNKSEELKDDIIKIESYYENIMKCENIQEIMGYEGLSSKLYFKHLFKDLNWISRKPRIKYDQINSCLDVGYTILFTFIDILLSIYGFDTYCGVLHRMFYMRKSLVCDLIEPFRVLIDNEIKTCFNINIFNKEDFSKINNRFELKWEESKKYVARFLDVILKNKEEIFIYIQRYYRCFMRDRNIEEYPIYNYIVKEVQ